MLPLEVFLPVRRQVRQAGRGLLFITDPQIETSPPPGSQLLPTSHLVAERTQLIDGDEVEARPPPHRPEVRRPDRGPRFGAPAPQQRPGARSVNQTMAVAVVGRRLLLQDDD